MKIKSFISIILIFVFTQNIQAQETPKSVSVLMEKALQQAKEQNKNIFVLFSASWCTWCKQMDSKLKNPSIKQLFSDHYIIEHFTVLEQKSKKHLVNPGAEELLIKYGGQNQGIPFYLIFDNEGSLIADSKMVKNKEILKGEGSNIGCPGTSYEIDAFAYKLKETSNLTDKELLAIAAIFKQD